MADLAPPPEAAAPHGAPWAPWGPMGPPWAPMGPHGALWGPMGALWAPHGAPWGPMGSYGPILWLDPIPFRAVDSRAGWREALFTLVSKGTGTGTRNVVMLGPSLR